MHHYFYPLNSGNDQAKPIQSRLIIILSILYLIYIYIFNTWKHCHHLHQNPKGPDASWRRKSLLQVFYSESSPSLQTESSYFVYIPVLLLLFFYLCFQPSFKCVYQKFYYMNLYNIRSSV